MAQDKYPPKPRVKLAVVVRNVGTQNVTLPPSGGYVWLTLIGNGAMNFVCECQTGQVEYEEGERRKDIALSPGQSHTIPIVDLDHEKHGASTYWLLPGDYAIYAEYRTSIQPVPPGAKANLSGDCDVCLRPAPVRVTVRATNSAR